MIGLKMKKKRKEYRIPNPPSMQLSMMLRIVLMSTMIWMINSISMSDFLSDGS